MSKGLIAAPLLFAGLLACADSAGPVVARGAAPAVTYADRSLVRISWRVQLADRGFFLDYKPIEGSTPAVLPDGLSAVVGSSDGSVRRISLRDGRVLWTTSTGGAVHGSPRVDGERIYIGSDDGYLYCIQAWSGQLLWKHRTGGTIRSQPLVSAGRVFVTSGDERLRALDALTGKWLWEYGRDLPDRFALVGASSPVLAAGRVLAGFADGHLVALTVEDGSLVWQRDLAGGAKEFTDVDSTPLIIGDLVVAASHSGGLHGVSLADGAVRWHLPEVGTGTPIADGSLLMMPTARGEILEVEASTGLLQRRVRVIPEGAVASLTRVGGWWLAGTASHGLLFLDYQRLTLLQRLDAGFGVGGAPTLVGRTLLVQTNGGFLYAYQLSG